MFVILCRWRLRTKIVIFFKQGSQIENLLLCTEKLPKFAAEKIKG